MPASPEDLFARLADLGIATTTVRHPPLHTVEESRSLRGTIPGGHCKNLFLKDRKGGLWLFVTLEDAAVDLKALAKRHGAARFSFASPELLMETLCVTPGAVTPFALINDAGHRVRVVLDAAMMRHERLNYHPLTNEATTSIARDDLVRFIRACGHDPEILAVADATVA